MLRRLCIPLAFLSCLSVASRAVQTATINTESVVYASPAARSATSLKLTSGSTVVLVVRIRNEEGSWCQVRQIEQKKSIGFVQCSTLDHQIRSQQEYDFAPITLAEGGDISTARCEDFNILSWLRRYRYTPQQMERAEKIADATGSSECERRAEPFKASYHSGMALREKIDMMRDWAKVDASDSCRISYVRFWHAARALMTEEQQTQMRADLPAVMALVEKSQGNLEKCIPLFCLY